MYLCACVRVCTHVHTCLCASTCICLYPLYKQCILTEVHMFVYVVFSRSTTAVMGAERKPLPLKSGSCLDILKPSKPVVEDKDSQGKHMATGENVCKEIYMCTVCVNT